jgi:hypothetical protein
MPLKLNVGLCRKVGEANYSSRGANINVEVEIDGALASEPDRLHERIRQLFGLVRNALVEELNGGSGHAPPANGDWRSGHGQPANGQDHGNGQTNGGNGNPGNGRERPATQSQVKAIYAIARSQRIDVPTMLRARFQVGRPDDLNIKEASSLIDELKRTGS